MVHIGRSCVVAAILALGLAATGASGHAGGTVTCEYTFVGWPGGFSANLRMDNAGPPITGWAAELVFDAPTTLGGAWLARMDQPDAVTMTAENLEFNATIHTGGAVTFGWTGTSAVHTVPAVAVNGVPC